MLKPKCRAVVLMIAVAGGMTGCYERVVIASSPCDELDRLTDPVKKADLEKRCGRGGPDFRPSRPKKY